MSFETSFSRRLYQASGNYRFFYIIVSNRCHGRSLGEPTSDGWREVES